MEKHDNKVDFVSSTDVTRRLYMTCVQGDKTLFKYEGGSVLYLTAQLLTRKNWVRWKLIFDNELIKMINNTTTHKLLVVIQFSSESGLSTDFIKNHYAELYTDDQQYPEGITKEMQTKEVTQKNIESGDKIMVILPQPDNKIPAINIAMYLGVVLATERRLKTGKVIIFLHKENALYDSIMKSNQTIQEVFSSDYEKIYERLYCR